MKNRINLKTQFKNAMPLSETESSKMLLSNLTNYPTLRIKKINLIKYPNINVFFDFLTSRQTVLE